MDTTGRSYAMDRLGLLTLSSYNGYANHLVLETARKLNEPDLLKEFSPSHGSISKLLYHMLDVETFFLFVAEVKAPLKMKPSDMADLCESWQQLDTERLNFISALNETDLARIVEVPFGSQPLQFTIAQILLQSLLHSTHHRGELSILLTEMGYPLPTLDIIIQFADQSGQPWPWK
jgi:uncharacterized damage-inducible protein DinB